LLSKNKWETERALLVQKVEYYEKDHLSFSEREKGQRDQIQKIREELTKEMKSKVDELTSKLHDKERECKIYQDRLGEAEEDLRTNTEKLTYISEQTHSQEKTLKEKMASLEAELKHAHEELLLSKTKGLHFELNNNSIT